MDEKKYFFGIITFIVVLDQAFKYLIVRGLKVGESIPVIKNVFHITFVTNTGAGFGILKNMNSILIWVSIFVIGLILYNYDEIPKGWLGQMFGAFIVGGALGNLIDRVFIGHVIDFLDFRIWPVFNIADSAITVGVIGLILLFWKK